MSGLINQSVMMMTSLLCGCLFVGVMVFVRFIYDYLPPSGRGTDVLRVILVDGGCRWVPVGAAGVSAASLPEKSAGPIYLRAPCLHPVICWPNCPVWS